MVTKDSTLAPIKESFSSRMQPTQPKPCICHKLSLPRQPKVKTSSAP